MYGGYVVQYGKVEICGVNTSQLKLLKESEKRELLLKIKNGTPAEKKAAREKMINGNLRLVLSVIQRFTNRGENPDDLFQVGVIGLIKAIDNFDPGLDVRFSTYGVPMIIGEIRRYLRDNNSVRVSRSMRDTAYRDLAEGTITEKEVQIMIPSYDFCVPRKECCAKTDDPCEVFSKIEFPTDSFFPRKSEECEKHDKPFECGCEE